MEHMESVFDRGVSPHEVARRLVRLCQGSETVAEFSVRFRVLAGETGWPEAPFMTQFSEALQDPIQDALAVFEPAGTLDTLISTAIRIHNHIRDRVRTKHSRRDRYISSSFQPFSTPPSFCSREEPMQIDGASCSPTGGISPEGCMYCKKQGHAINQCPQLKGKGRSCWGNWDL